MPAEIRIARIRRPGSRADLIPRLVKIQKLIGADNFAVYRVGEKRSASRQRLVCELENWGAGNAENGPALIGAYGEALIDHVDKTLLPLMWNGRNSNVTAETPDFTTFVKRITGEVLPFAGVAFPVRLGNIGNGFVLFTGEVIDLASDIVVDVHGRACQIMIDLLAMDERKTRAVEALSEREISCLQLAGDGRKSEEIAEKLGLSMHTVNAYLGSATVKLDSVNRMQAIAKAIRLGYIS